MSIDFIDAAGNERHVPPVDGHQAPESLWHVFDDSLVCEGCGITIEEHWADPVRCGNSPQLAAWNRALRFDTFTDDDGNKVCVLCSTHGRSSRLRREARKRGPKRFPQCGSHWGEYTCTRRKDHSGLHAMCGLQMHPAMAWHQGEVGE